MRFLRHSVTGLFLLGLTIALALFALQLISSAIQDSLAEERRAPPARERVFAVNVITASLGEERPELTGFGHIESRRTLELRAAVSGRVISLAEGFQDGGRVTAGDTLVEIDKADAQATLARAEADMMDAEAESRDAGRALGLAMDELETAQMQAELQERAYQRQVDLKSRGVGTEASVEAAELTATSARQAVITRRQAVSQAEARVDQAQTLVARAQIALDEAQRTLEDTTVTAPFTGTLQAVTLVEGRLVSANEILAQLVDPDLLEVAFRVSTAQYARLLEDTGQLIPAEVTVTLDAAGAGIEAKGMLVRASGAVGDGQSGRLIYARMDNATGFKPGDFVTITVREPVIANLARLPASAMDSRQTVLVLGDDDRLEEVQVELVRRQGDEILVRGDGLNGRQVVTGRTPLLGAGIKVRPLTKGADNAVQAVEPDLIELTDERRAQLKAIVTDNGRMPSAVKTRVLAQLDQPRVPATLIDRIEQNRGG
ncbi:efflux RND transporter periplasmic adaptor subunit [Tritonibacter mobilis]|uniref:efflux RND transporter periplasmic adaptor subunit n=1 Tax=Tritonibacter mobilis TaxID=379347 RepID=UPI000806C36D|nr:efflux RND transporter periplasmic adaptor subunit [Tritonibacter mobilis]MBU3034563.1 efflux RND transporter periplasmic adaptor subunit [Tritonibacter mobilis]WHQ84697.1 efflux RND transporter periplasmic adaptor subunit [Tritonibacter mobilis]